MEQLNATEAKREFGELLMKVQKEPIGIIKNGKPVAVVISDETFRVLEKIKMQALKRSIAEGMEDVDQARVHDVGDVFKRLRQKVKDWKSK